MIDENGLSLISAAIQGLQNGDAGAWKALAPLTKLSAEGTDISIDFTAQSRIGVPIVVASRTRRALPTNLTQRQKDVVAAISRGLSNKIIARELGISPATVKDHVHAVLEKLELKSRAELAAFVHGAT